MSTRKNSTEIFPIAAVGASAGGIEAAKIFFENIARNTGIAFVYIQHLSANHSSNLADIMSKNSPLLVEEATDGLRISPDHIYVITPNKQVEIENGVIRL